MMNDAVAVDLRLSRDEAAEAVIGTLPDDVREALDSDLRRADPLLEHFETCRACDEGEQPCRVARMAGRGCRRCGEPFLPTEAQVRSYDFICRPCRSVFNATRREASARAGREFVAALNARTSCSACGAQPVEWHNPEHVELGRQNFRISSLAHSGKPIADIEAEIARCTPLCRRCHMVEDGRLRAFLVYSYAPKPKKPPSLCSACGEIKRLLARGLCNRCYCAARAKRRAEASGERLVEAADAAFGRLQAVAAGRGAEAD
jgi:hypothetical protein